jgi:hypothetical protein
MNRNKKLGKKCLCAYLPLYFTFADLITLSYTFEYLSLVFNTFIKKGIPYTLSLVIPLL